MAVLLGRSRYAEQSAESQTGHSGDAEQADGKVVGKRNETALTVKQISVRQRDIAKAGTPC